MRTADDCSHGKTTGLALLFLLVGMSSAIAQGPGSSGGSPAGGDMDRLGPSEQRPGLAGEGTLRPSPGDPTVRYGPGWLAKAIKEFDRWLYASGEGRALSAVREGVLAVAVNALRAGVPPDAFKLRLREAVAKKVPPETILKAIEYDASYWIRVSEMIGTDDWPPGDKSPGFYIAAGNALRNGLGEPAVRDVIAWARGSRGAPERAEAALTTVASIAIALRADDAQAAVMVRGLAGSRLRVGEFGNVAELAGRAFAAGISASGFSAKLASVLNAGGSLRELERQLFP